MRVVRVGEGEIHILPAVRGLPSEAQKVTVAFESARPTTVALSVSPEDAESIRRLRGTPMESDRIEDEVYIAGLSAWEDPVMPPPCFAQALRLADRSGVPVEALDFDEEAYADAYTESVSAFELILQGRLEGRLSRKKFRVSTPEEFVLAWDAEVNRPAGFAGLQRKREKHMAVRLREIAGHSPRVLAVIEVERADGVLGALRA